jgi:hypothetical protein
MQRVVNAGMVYLLACVTPAAALTTARASWLPRR